ncbi:helix-turn-helix transcriptional regulator [Chthonobacter rhizosphaerae]|uniref:helix-turn-helix transcriptional regulator n=1 Tax=Chthonobacter rhizosphaerae TaxID=2735553 RepID=UPI0015EF4857|nr:helix-turn-helix transcriptional regulator [Chthonobacter rhizosphaerae]
MVDGEKIALLINDIYDAATDESLWPAALHNFSRCFGGVGTVLHSLSSLQSLVYVSDDLSEPAEDYRSFWWQYDPLVRSPYVVNLKNGIFHDRDVLEEDVISRGVYYNEFLAKQGIGGAIGIVSSPTERSKIAIGVQLPPGAEVRGSEKRIFSQLSLHITRAASMGSLVSRLEATQGALLEGIGRFSCAAAVVRRDGFVISANAYLYALLGNGVGLRQNRLHVDLHEQQRALERLIASVAAGEVQPAASDVIVLRRSGRHPTLVVRAMPLTGRHIDRIPGTERASDAVLLLISGGDIASADNGDHVFRSMGLTRTQARIARMLGDAKAATEIATELGVSVNTVRTTIKAIYLKLGVNRQAEIVRLLSSLRAFI